MREAVDKIAWFGTVLGIQPRIRLTRSYDERLHNYLGYMLYLEGSVGSDEMRYSVGLGTTTFDKHDFEVGDQVRGLGVSAPATEPADLYRASKLHVLERNASASRDGPPWRGRGPDLPAYRRRGHRRLDPRTFETRCRPCKWGCRMAVEIILDKWNPQYRRHRYETFCYGPLACPSYRAGRLRTVPWKGGPAWEEPAWVDEEETGHRRPND